MMNATLLAADTGATGIAALGVDLMSLIVYLINFGILLLVLYFVAYKRLLGMLDQRSKKIKDSLEEAERAREASAQSQADVQQALEQNRHESQRILSEAREMADQFRQHEADKAREQATQIVERAKVEIERERDMAVEQVREELANLTVIATERVIHKSLDPKTHQDLIDEVLKSSNTFRKGGS
jgi:F-type H+-transporting ATPase subunit b